jgi:MFS family permease
VGKGIRTSPRDKLLAASAEPERLAEAYSFHRGMDHLGAAVGPLVAAALLLVWPGQLRLVFALAAVPGALAVALLFAVREAPTATPIPTSSSTSTSTSTSNDTLARRPPAGLLASIFLFTLGNSTDALLLLRAQGLGVPTALLPVLWTELHVVRAATSWPLGRLADRLGRSASLAAGWGLYAVCYLGFAVAADPWQVWALFAAYGLVAGLTEGTERALVASSVPRDRRGRALGLYNLVSGFGLLIASVLAGELWDHVSPGAALGLGAALAAAAAVLLLARPGAAQPA